MLNTRGPQVKMDKMEEPLASRKRRIAAVIIDYALLYSFIPLAVMLLMGADFLDTSNFTTALIRAGLVFFFSILLFGIKDMYRGTSPGKWILGIAIRDRNSVNELPSKLRLFARNLFMILWPVELLVLVFNKKKRRLGDLVCGTQVISQKQPAKRGNRIAVLATGLVVGGSILFMGTSLTIKSSAAYDTAIRFLENNDEIYEKTGGIDGFGYFPGGKINITNGFGEARIDVRIQGKDQDVGVEVYLVKPINEDWRVTSVKY